MAGRGGARPGAGRPKGLTKESKTNAERREIWLAGGITPIEYLLAVVRDETETRALRMKAASDAAPYVHPKLAQVESKSEVQQTVQFVTLPGEECS